MAQKEHIRRIHDARCIAKNNTRKHNKKAGNKKSARLSHNNHPKNNIIDKIDNRIY